MIDINELVLKIPDIGKEEGRRLAAEVSQKLAARLPANVEPLRIEHVQISLSYSPGASRTQLAELLAEAIWKDILPRITKPTETGI